MGTGVRKYVKAILNLLTAVWLHLEDVKEGEKKLV